jgi:hypothetical protein
MTDETRYIVHVGKRPRNPAVACRVVTPDGRAFSVIRSTDPDDDRPATDLRSAVDEVLKLADFASEAEAEG